MTEKFGDKYRIPSARAQWHDYNCGVYFVTICTRKMECSKVATQPLQRDDHHGAERIRYAVAVESMKKISKRKGRLSVLIGSFKSAVTKYASEHDILFDWQTRFYDHIVRNDEDRFRIEKYIVENVKNWRTDCFNV